MFIAVLLLSIILSVVLSPDIALQASLSGLTIWWKLVFPGLLPFLILYEIMLAFGLLHGIQAIIAPLTSRLMKLPKVASLPFVMSLFGGFPVGVEPTLKLMEEKQLTPSQAQRLLGYIHVPNPIFVVVIIGTGFLTMPILGLIIVTTIWITTFVLMTLHGIISSHEKQPSIGSDKPQQQLAFAASMQSGRNLDGRSLGKVLGDSVYASVQKLFAVGGFIIFSSVIAAFVTPMINSLLPQLPFVTPALLELHIGSYAISAWAINQDALQFGCAFIVACLSFSGISGILQISFYITGKSLRLIPFVIYRMTHAIIGFAMTYIMWKPLSWVYSKWLHIDNQSVFFAPEHNIAPIWYQAQQLPYLWRESLLLCTILLILIGLGAVWHQLRTKHDLL